MTFHHNLMFSLRLSLDGPGKTRAYIASQSALAHDSALKLVHPN